MKACPKCQRVFPADASFCASDGTGLADADTLPIPPDPSDPFIGGRIGRGRYEIRRVVADGGMGRVYEGRQIDMPRRVAVKILHQDVAADTVNIERFKREAETSRSLDHAHIIEVFDFAQEPPTQARPEGAWFLIMEFLEGDELRVVLDKQKTLPIERVIEIMSQAAIGLDGAHRSGAVHRDLKPDNIFLVDTGSGDRVKVLDFGSVKFTKGQDKGQKLTVMGTTIGSPFYMSPEQARGAADLDHRTDVWAMGAIVYEMTVGRVPFSAANGPQILFKILGEEPMPPSFANDAAPPQVDDFITKALAKKKEDRFPSCGAMADALGRAFGLQGDHLRWAQMTPPQIAAEIKAAAGASASAAPMSIPGAAPMQMQMQMQPRTAAPAQMQMQPMQGRAPAPARNNGMPSGGALPDVDPSYNPVKPVPVALYAGIGAIVLAVLALGAVLALK